jgi:hypothetical protein
MASGIEAAGLALATFSILLQFVEGYHTIKDAKNYKLTLKRLDRELGMEKCIFANTCRNFLKDIVSAEDVEAFVSGVGWGNLDFQEKLKQHLGLENAKAFTEGVEALHESLQRLNQEVQLDGKQKV